MASKRLNMIDYEETSSEEEDDMHVETLEQDDYMAQQEHQHKTRPGRPRKPSLTNTNSSVDTLVAVSTGARRRGRGPSKRPCLNRNALMARENRQRKKEYMERIEAKLQNYQEENQELTSTIQKQNIEIKRLTTEVTYLRSVLKNQTMITTLLKSMNDNLGRMHGDGSQVAVAAPQPTAMSTTSGNEGIAKASSDVLNWVVSGQTNSSKTNNMPLPSSGMTMRNYSEVKDDNRRLNYGQQTTINNTVKIARKTMPFTQKNQIKMEDPSSVESLFDDEDQMNVQNTSPQSGSFCEYIPDRGSVGHDNQQPTTPMSAMFNSADRVEASLSNTDFTLSVDNFLDNFGDDVPLQFDQTDLFTDEALFNSLGKEPSDALPNGIADPLEISKMAEAINDKENQSLLDNLDNAGVCLHINSTRVSLEYCSVCHLNSLNSEKALTKVIE